MKWTLISHILVNIHSKSKNRAETNQTRWAKQTSHTSVAKTSEKPQDCKMPEQLLKGLHSLREGLHIKLSDNNIYTHLLINNAGEQRSKLPLQKTKETGKGFLSNTLYIKCGIQKMSE